MAFMMQREHRHRQELTSGWGWDEAVGGDGFVLRGEEEEYVAQNFLEAVSIWNCCWHAFFCH
jgi:hypothetical protein